MESAKIESGEKVVEGSKIVYINDSYNLDTIPFDVDEIIDTEIKMDID